MARERCYKVCLQYGRRWMMGEEREISSFDDNGLPVASPHFRIVQPGEADDTKVVLTKEQQSAEDYSALRGDREFGIRKALEALDPADNNHWTIKGQPSLQRVFAITGFEIQRADIVEAWPEFDRDLAKSLKKR